MCQGAAMSRDLIGNPAGLFYNYDFIIAKNCTLNVKCVGQNGCFHIFSIYQGRLIYIHTIQRKCAALRDENEYGFISMRAFLPSQCCGFLIIQGLTLPTAPTVAIY